MVRLVRIARDALTITRRRKGRGFCYLDGDGKLIADPDTKARLNGLGIPPAWREVCIAPHPRGHIQAVGTDEAGRVQYIYHPDWEARRTGKKQQRLAQLTGALPRLRRKIQADLAAEAGDKRLALAIAVAMIDKTAMRVGREKYLESSGTRGAGTLYARDVRVNGDEVCAAFDAKGGKRAEYCVTDGLLADAVGRIKTLSGKRLLVYRDETGKVCPLKTSAINAYLRRLAGVEIAAKDFRTLHASAMAGEALARLEAGSTVAARRRQMAQVTRTIADVLRNTPMICRKSYIAPCLFKLFDEGKLAALWTASGSGKTGLLQREARLGAVLAELV